MLFRFTGTYTGGRSSITVFGVTFEGREPAEVTDEDGIRRLSTHQEFEAVSCGPQFVADPEMDKLVREYVEEFTPPAKKRGRPRKT